eukprot:TRINITY_DN3193_c4_g1_i2.p1 TRINITY_DN3193_c4_g1~~TRINITY_DN3193_c4_g1_i2.p1  ORF type:complete len:161 (-),score=54.22 TRINITY_DN3193_c4_g1_i2:11-493(-)
MARLHSQRFYHKIQQPIPVEPLVRAICDEKQAYTQHGGLRPHGVAFLYAGYDKQRGFQLYWSDPSGNYRGWKAHSIGRGSSTSQTFLQEEYSDELLIEDALHLAAKTLAKVVDASCLTTQTLEFCVLELIDGEPTVRHLIEEEIQALIDPIKAERDQNLL